MNKIIVEAIDYIMKNLTEELTVEEIANHCHYSKYYFNRMFKDSVGESVYSFIKRQRVQSSAFKIANNKDMSITNISCDYGYSSSNYSSLFKSHYGISPVEFKKYRNESRIYTNGKEYYADLSTETCERIEKNMRIVTIEDLQVYFKRYIGNYHNLYDYWTDFINENTELFSGDYSQIELSYDDPVISDSERCIIDLCILTDKISITNCNRMTLDGGKYAVYDFEGHSREIFKVFQSLMCIWMPKTSMKVDFEKRKMFSKYLKIDCENNIFAIEIYIPIL